MHRGWDVCQLGYWAARGPLALEAGVEGTFVQEVIFGNGASLAHVAAWRLIFYQLRVRALVQEMILHRQTPLACVADGGPVGVWALVQEVLRHR